MRNVTLFSQGVSSRDTARRYNLVHPSLAILGVLIIFFGHRLWEITPDHPCCPVWLHQIENYFSYLALIIISLGGHWILEQARADHPPSWTKFTPGLIRWIGFYLVFFYLACGLGLSISRPDGELNTEAEILKVVIHVLWFLAWIGGGIACFVFSWFSGRESKQDI